MPDPDIRERVLDALALIHIAPRIMAARPDVPAERIAYALCRYWMDVVFEPGLRYVDGFKGDRDPKALDRFEAAFNEDEWEYLERFHRFVELRLDRLGPQDHADGQYPVDDSWHGITRDARNTAELLGDDPQERAKRLGRLAGAMAGRLPDRPS